MSRARTVCACAAASAVLGGCAAATTTGSTVTGSTLIVYAGQPPGGANSQQAQDVLDGERLALQQAGAQTGHFKVVLKPVQGAKISANARSAISDSSAIAYIGEIAPGGSADSIGITNGAGLLQISPTDTAIELTQKSAAVPGSPGRYYESTSTYGQTFGRVVPAANHEAVVQARAMQSLGVKRLYVADDGGSYGRAIALAVAQNTAADGIAVTRGAADATKVSAAGADAVFVGASDQAAAARLLSAVALTSPKTKLFAPSALGAAGFATSLTPAAQRNLIVSEPGFIYAGPQADLTPAGQKFVADFKSAYQRVPGQSAIFGYAAMQVLLDALHNAGTNVGNRSAVVAQFRAVKAYPSVLGTYSIGLNGDITGLAPYIFSHVRAGKVVPFEAMQG